MKSNVDILIDLYREVIGSKSPHLLSDEMHRKGSCISAIPTVNKLCARIDCGTHQPEGKYTQSAIFKVYVPGAGPDGQDAVYLEIQAFDPSESPRMGHNRFLYDGVPGREIAAIKECQVILNLHDQMCLNEVKNASQAV